MLTFIVPCLSVSPWIWRSVRPCEGETECRYSLVFSPVLLLLIADMRLASLVEIARTHEMPPAWPMTASRVASHWSRGGGSTDVTLTSHSWRPGDLGTPTLLYLFTKWNKRQNLVFYCASDIRKCPESGLIYRTTKSLLGKTLKKKKKKKKNGLNPQWGGGGFRPNPLFTYFFTFNVKKYV